MKETILVLTNSIAGLQSFRKEVMKAIVDEGYQLFQYQILMINVLIISIV